MIYFFLYSYRVRFQDIRIRMAGRGKHLFHKFKQMSEGQNGIADSFDLAGQESGVTIATRSRL